MSARTSRIAAVLSALLLIAVPTGLFSQASSSGDTQITILQTTDLHDHANGVDHVGLDVNPITATSTLGAYSRIATYVDYVRHTTRHPVLLVDSGDWTMGTFYDLTLGTQPLALNFLKHMRYDCITLGNHEFDYTSAGLAKILDAAVMNFGFHTPIVASNLNLNGDSDLAPFIGDGKLIQNTRVEKLPGGLKVGYIGLMGQNAAGDIFGAAPVTFTSPSSEYPAIQALVDDLRNNQGAQVVIVLSHSGTNAAGTSGEDIDLAKHVSGIDVIASGHTHTPLSEARAVSNGNWTTQVIDAGAFGSNVARIDLTYHASSNTTTFDSYSNLPMTDDTLMALDPSLSPDVMFSVWVQLTDQELNAELAPFFSQAFPDYDSAEIGTGLYHPVGTAAQDMVSNSMNLAPSPNGLGDLTADAIRSVPNAIIAQTLAAVGGNPANLPGYDFTPVQGSAVGTGVIRGKLQTGVPLSFADIYNVLPLGISPDSSQALPVGFPLVSAYLELADVQKLCALQLVAQTGLVNSDFYLNLSGLQYSLNPAQLYVYFKYATAAEVLQVTSQKAGAGSAAAGQALLALSTLATDHGGALLGAYAAGNPYAAAMVKLNDASPGPAQIGANLGALGQVAGAAAAGGNVLSALIVSKAVAAVGTVAGFAPGDSANIGPASPLPNARVRMVTDLSAILLLASLQQQYGLAITAYASVTGTTVLSGADIPGLLQNRIDAAPGTAGVQELKEWMALLSYLKNGLGGSIGSEYLSTPNFSQFGSYGLAVKLRNASYPAANIGQLLATAGALQSAP